MNLIFFLCFDICNYICLDTSDHFSALPSYIFFIFSSTLVLTSSIDVVFILSILIQIINWSDNLYTHLTTALISRIQVR